MAVIGKIREKSWLLVIVVGIAMLAFVLGDLGFSGGGGPQEDIYGIGTINNEKVDENQYNTFLNNARENILQSKFQQNPMEQPTITEADIENAANQAWTTSVVIALMEKEYAKLGLIVDDYELENVLYGQNGFPPSSMSSQFKDSITGEFAPEQLRMALEQLRDANDVASVTQYNNVIDYVRQERLEQKYNVLLSMGIHATTLEGKAEYDAKNTVKNVSYVYERYTKVPLSEVEEPTEDEIKDYFNAHKNEAKYKQQASRKVSYFTMPVLPSGEDTLRAIEFLETLKPRFETTKNDSTFVMRFSEVKFYASDSTAIARPQGSASQGATYPSSIENEVKSASVGDVVGPYLGNNGATLSKIIGFSSEETATVRHILLNASTPEEVRVAQNRADSLIRVIRAGGDFEELVTLFSEDQGSLNTGGKYENFTRGVMVPEFNDFSFNRPIGTLGSVKTDFGIHIVEVLERKTTNYPLFANVVKGIEVTKMTQDQVNSMASNLIYEIDELFTGKTAEEKTEIFENFVFENGYQVRSAVIMDENPSVRGFSSRAEGRLLRLAYSEGAQVGDISSSPILDGNRIVVAMLSDIVEEGEPRLDLVRDRMIAEIKKEKQAQYLIDKMVGNTNVESLAIELGAKLETEGITFSANNVAVGNEPKIIGTAFSGLLDGETSVPVQGNNGVFVLRVDQTTMGQETTDYSAEQQQIKSQALNSLQTQFQNALMNSADVIDNRKLRSHGIR